MGRISNGYSVAGRSFTPARLFASGEEGAWYDPSDLSTMFTTAAGSTPASVDGPVGRIEDKSGNANHATQATAAARPTLRQTAGGLYYLEFDGVDDSLESSAIAFGGPHLTVAAVAPIALGSAQNILDSDGAIRIAQFLRTNASAIESIAFAGASAFTDAAGTSVSNGVAAVLSSVASNTGSKVEAWVNRNSNGSTAVTGTLNSGSQALSMGRRSTVYANIELYGAVLVASETTDADRNSAEGFMATKAGVTL